MTMLKCILICLALIIIRSPREKVDLKKFNLDYHENKIQCQYNFGLDSKKKIIWVDDAYGSIYLTFRM